MGTDDRTVVVTGMGATTPLGGDVESTWAGMLAGRSGGKALTDDWAKDLPARIAGVAAVALLMIPFEVNTDGRANGSADLVVWVVAAAVAALAVQRTVRTITT